MNQTPSYGRTALYMAAEQNHGEICDILLDNGAFINAQNADGWAPVHAAVSNACFGPIRSLIRHHADLDIVAKNGDRPLHLAAQKNRSGEAELLVAAGANPDDLDASGNTPITVAYLNNSTEIIKSLLSYGADPTIKNNAGRTAEDEARLSGNADALHCLTEYQGALAGPTYKTQTYPGECPNDHNPVGTGATERNQLGYSVDTVYKMEYKLAYSGSTQSTSATPAQPHASVTAHNAPVHRATVTRVSRAASKHTTVEHKASKPVRHKASRPARLHPSKQLPNS